MQLADLLLLVLRRQNPKPGKNDIVREGLGKDEVGRWLGRFENGESELEDLSSGSAFLLPSLKFKRTYLVDIPRTMRTRLGIQGRPAQNQP